MITIKTDYNFDTLKNVVWGDSAFKLYEFELDGLERELMIHLEDYFGKSVPSLYEVNKYIATLDKSDII